MRGHLRQVERQTGKTMIHEETPPDGFEYLLEMFWSVSGGRGEGFSGCVPLTSQEIQAWSEMGAIELEPWEFRTIRRMDRAFMAAIRKD